MVNPTLPLSFFPHPADTALLRLDMTTMVAQFTDNLVFLAGFIEHCLVHIFLPLNS